jgi:stage III sporulation protein AG
MIVSKMGEGLSGISKKKLLWLVALFLIGVILLTLSNFLPGERDNKAAQTEVPPPQAEASSNLGAGTTDTIAQVEASIEGRLENILSKVEGVGDVSVTVTLINGPQYIYATNENVNETTTEENESNGSRRVTTDTTSSVQTVLAQPANMGGQEPVVVKEIKGEIGGVLVAAEGARDAQVKETLTRAVQTLLDIPAHKVSILAKQTD